MNDTNKESDPRAGATAPAVENVIVDTVAFDSSKDADYTARMHGYSVKASYLKEPRKGDALIEIFKDGKPLRAFLFPAYKIYNIAAHFGDIVDGELRGDSHGYQMAAWNGIENAIFFIPETQPATP